MKPIKFLVLAAGLTGIAAFFLPLIAVTDGTTSVTIKGIQTVTGIESAAELTNSKAAAAGVDDATVAGINKAFDDVKLIVMIVFVPAVLCTLFGLIGVIKGSFGRGLGIGVLLFGGLGLAIWALLNAASNEAGAESGLDVKG